MKHTIAIAALVATSSLGALAPLPAFAQETTLTVAHRGGPAHFRMMRHGPPMGFAGFFCRDNAAEAMEIALVRLSYRLDLTEAQKPLFETFRDSALAAQADFAEACTAAMPEENAAPDMLDMLKLQLAMSEAQATALSAVLPDFEAFYTSLTAEQLASLRPGDLPAPPPAADAEGSDDRNAPGRSDRDDAPGRSDRDAAPGRTDRAPAPGR